MVAFGPVFDLDINQGTTFTQQFIYFQPDGVTPVNLTGCTVRLQVRFGHEQVPVILEVNNVGLGGITLNATQGQVNVTFTEAQTQLFEFLQAFYDIKIQFPGDTSAVRLVQGKVKVNANITQ